MQSRKTSTMFAVVCGIALGTFCDPSGATNWPSWRGPFGSGITTETDLPLSWTSTENVAWRVELPEAGNSSPVVWEDKIFLTQPEGDKRKLMCFDRQGDLLWEKVVEYSQEEATHRTNPYCSPSPVTDGERVIVWYGSAGLHCYDTKGSELWSVDLGKQEHMWGYGTSPILHENLCILSFGPGTREFVVAIDKVSGKEVWRHEASPPDPKGDTVSDGNGGSFNRAAPGKSRKSLLRGSWGTPLVIEAGGRHELIINWPTELLSLDPRTGKRLWACDGLGALTYASPVWGDGILLALGGYHSASIAVKPGGSGDVTESHRVWQIENSPLLLGTGVIKDGFWFNHTMDGIVRCVELESGDTVWQERFAGGDSKNASWNSMVLAGDRIYLLNQSGDTLIFRAAPKYELIAKNSLGEQTNSTIAVSDGQIFIRTHESLWCIGERISRQGRGN